MPEQLQQYIAIFEKYGDIQFEGAIHAYLDELSPEELVDIQSYFQQLLVHDDDINNWIDSVGLTNSRAAALAYFTLSFFAIANDRKLFQKKP